MAAVQPPSESLPYSTLPHSISLAKQRRPITDDARHRSGTSISYPSSSSPAAAATMASPHADPVNPLHALSHPSNGTRPQEVHIVKVSGDAVRIEQGPPPQHCMHKVGRSLARAVTPIDALRERENVDTVGPPPPSPPASEEHMPDVDQERDGDEEVFYEDEEELVGAGPLQSPPMRMVKSEPAVTFDESVRERSSSASSSSRPLPGPSSNAGVVHRSSTDTSKTSPPGTSTSFSVPGRRRRSSTQSSEPAGADADDHTSSSKGSRNPANANNGSLHTSADGLLQPPPSALHASRPTRRNTTGSTTNPVKPHRKSTMPHTMEEPAADGELASDIQMQAEQIRRERQSKRQKAQQDAEAALTRSRSTNRSVVGGVRDDDNKEVLVGNLIGEDHVNYVLMYNMLTGIRIAVSRCQAKIKRTLVDEDFTACHKYSFDILGNELTPAAKYDFKFKDYAPWVFRELRENYFYLDPSDYLVSLTAKYILSELGSPGKSGSFFYFSRDYRFIIKTIHHSEHKFLRSILPRYYAHIKDNPHTLLSRFYGLHRVKLPRGKKIHFVIMNNLFPAHRDIHETYDLKGSTVGREYPEEMAEKNPRAVLKDLNWINRGKMLELGPEKRALLTEQLRRDSELLKALSVMDYSLLVGIHSMRRGNRDNVRRNTLKVFSPNVPVMKRKATQLKGSSPEAIAMRRAMRESDPKRLDAAGADVLPDEDTGDRQHYLFYQDEGGLRATDEANEEMDTLYYLGIIDILTPYSGLKKIEHLWKGLQADRHKISPVPPHEYGDRFFSFMRAIMRGGGGGEQFKPDYKPESKPESSRLEEAEPKLEPEPQPES